MKSVMKTLQQLLMKKNYCELKESIRIMKTQSDTEKNNFFEQGKRKGIDKIIRQNAKV